MGDPHKSKKADPGLVRVGIALVLVVAWAGSGILRGSHERRSVAGFVPFFLAFVVLQVIGWVLFRKR